MKRPLLEFTDKGIYCARADVYLDPWKPVKKALISHGHSDHSRWGHSRYITHKKNVPIIRHRLGEIQVTGVDWGEPVRIAGVTFSFHPAGHIIGSSQIRVEHKGEVWVFSGDYKSEDDGLATPYEPIRCHTFITECTFGLPAFSWRPQQEVIDQIKGEKTINFVKRRRKHSSKRTKGHRQQLTLVRITDILEKGAGKSGVKAALNGSGFMSASMIERAANPGMPASDKAAANAARASQPKKAAAPKAAKPAAEKKAAPKKAAKAAEGADDLSQISGIGPVIVNKDNLIRNRFIKNTGLIRLFHVFQALNLVVQVRLHGNNLYMRLKFVKPGTQAHDGP